MKIKSMILAVVALMTLATTAIVKPVKPGQWKTITLADGTKLAFALPSGSVLGKAKSFEATEV